jgi:trimethylamine--corrinoid protein Co-methyltransferase
VNADELALDAIAQVDPGGHHFGTPHTLARYEKAFYIPMLSSRQNFESWQETGSQDAARRANATWKRMLAEYQAPALDPAIAEALAAFVERRKREIAAAAA